MKILNFIKNNWSQTLLVIVFLLFIIFGGLDKCSIRHTDNIVDQVEVSQRENFIIDSVNSANSSKVINAIDSINKKRCVEVTELNKKISNRDNIIAKQKVGLDTLLAKFENGDSTQHTLPACEEIVNIQKNVIKQQDLSLKDRSSIILKQDSTIKDGVVKYNLKSEELVRVRDMYKTCDNNTKLLIKELHSKDNWWRRNEKWFYFVGGVIGVTGIVYMLK